MPVDDRPFRGLPIEEALREFSDHEAFASAEEYADAKKDTAWPGVGPPTLQTLRHYEWRKRRRALEEALHQKLNVGELFASAIPEYGDRREVLHPSIFDLFWIDYRFEEVCGEGRSYKKPEIFQARAIPRNITDVPYWVRVPAVDFQPDADYRHVVFRGVPVQLGAKQAKVIEALHHGATSGDPWLAGKVLLEYADSGSEHLRELMGDKMYLVDSDGRGLYRLKLGEDG